MPADDQSPRPAVATDQDSSTSAREASSGTNCSRNWASSFCAICGFSLRYWRCLALADALAVAAVPGAGLLHQLGIHAHVDQLALAADALAVQDLGEHLLQRGRHLVLDHFDLGLVANDLVALLDRADTADVQADRGVELERVAAGGHFRALARHHDPDLVAQLGDEDKHAITALDVSGGLAPRL